MRKTRPTVSERKPTVEEVKPTVWSTMGEARYVVGEVRSIMGEVRFTVRNGGLLREKYGFLWKKWDLPWEKLYLSWGSDICRGRRDIYRWKVRITVGEARPIIDQGWSSIYGRISTMERRKTLYFVRGERRVREDVPWKKWNIPVVGEMKFLLEKWNLLW